MSIPAIGQPSPSDRASVLMLRHTGNKGRPATKWQLVGRSYHQHKLFLCHITLERASYRRASGLQLHRKAIWLKCACRPASMLLVCYSSLLRWCYQILCLAHTPVTFHASEC